MGEEDDLPKVSTVYHGIFQKDPFLIEEKHQQTFGIQIARNLLVERSIAASEPAEISLHARASRTRFKETRPMPPPLDEPSLTQRYWDSRNNRAKISKEDLERLRDYTMVARGDLTQERRGIEIESDGDAAAILKDTGSPMTARLKFAAIGYRVPIGRLPRVVLSEHLQPLSVLEEDDDLKLDKLSRSVEQKGVNKIRRTARAPTTDYVPWRNTIERHVQAALNSGAQFILLPEFGLPPDDETWSALTAFKKLASRPEQAEADDGKASSYGKTPEFLLFSGTRHEGAFNRGFILARGKDTNEMPDEWWHYKVASARSLGENIMGPQSHKLPSYTFNLTPPTPPGTSDPILPMRCKVYLGICYDVFDPTTFINYVVQCASQDNNAYDNLILVPSFNPGSDFHHALRDLSFVGSCPILYVNALHGDSKLFLFGFDIMDILKFEQTKPSPSFSLAKADHIDEAHRSGEKTRLDEYLCSQLNSKRDELKDAASVSKALETARDATDDNYIFLEMARLLSESHAKEKRLQNQIAQVERLHNKIREYRSFGALKSLVTQQGCPTCKEKKNHSQHDYCGSDILYYNIDPRLYLLLKEFRASFFGSDDSFLPEPFRYDIRRKIRGKIANKLRDLDLKRRKLSMHRA